MKTNKLFLTGAAAALSLGLSAGVYAQTAGTVRGDDTDSGTRLQTDTSRLGTSAADQSSIYKVNKASGLIGMDVRNQQNERLGEIKDLVLDLKSGKISYAVLSVGGFLGIGDKYVAVPPSAFSMTADQDRLVLNADKAKIQNAPGFAKNAWPDLHSPTWTTDSQYWLSETAQGTAGAVSSGTGLGTDAARVQSGAASSSSSGVTDTTRTLPSTTPDANRNLDRSSTATGGQFDRSASAARENTFRGRITAVNPTTRTVTVEGPSGTREFKFTEKPTLTLKENRNPSLIDFKVGFPVSVGYHEEGGSYVAHSLTRTDAPEVK